MSWTCPGHYKVHVHGRDSPGRPIHGHCPVPLPALVIEAIQDIVHIVPRFGKTNEYFVNKYIF